MTYNDVRRSAVAVAILLVASAGLTSPALAHAHLQAETPTADATTPSPESLTLSFSEGLELKFTTVAVKGPNGMPVTTGPNHLAQGNPKLLLVPVVGKLEPGRYTVDWKAVATDGHKTHGTYGFTVAP